MRLPRRYRAALFALLMSCFTALPVSGAITALHSVSLQGFVGHWMHAFLTAWPLVFVAILVIAPRVAQLVECLLQPDRDA